MSHTPPHSRAQMRLETRRAMRKRRRALTPSERRIAAHAALKNLRALVRLRSGLRLAVYLSVDGELDTRPLIDHARRQGCRIYVPVLHGRRRTMQFMPLAGPMRRNRYCIPEPVFSAKNSLNPRALELAIMPLIAFGPHGERLGSGAGFYDQTFAFLRRRKVWKKPRLIGWAYDWQQVDALTAQCWDVPMQAVASDANAYRFIE